MVVLRREANLLVVAILVARPLVVDLSFMVVLSHMVAMVANHSLSLVAMVAILVASRLVIKSSSGLVVLSMVAAMRSSQTMLPSRKK